MKMGPPLPSKEYGSNPMKKMKFVVSLITLDNDYQIEQAVAAEQTARGLGVDIQIIYADSDAITQSQQLLEIIQSNPDSHPNGIILESAGGTGFPQVARAAAKAGIGWVLLNRHVPYISDLREIYRTPLFCVSSDNKMVGRIQGNQFRALLPDGGSVLYIQGPSDSATAMQRTEGMLETKGDIQVKLMRGQWTEASSYRAISSWLQLSTSRQSHFDIIAAQNDAMAMGARKAFGELTQSDANQHWLDLPFLGVDGVRKTGLTWVKRGLLSATIVVPPNSSTALEMLARALQTSVIPPEITTISPTVFPSMEELSAAHRMKKYVSTQP